MSQLHDLSGVAGPSVGLLFGRSGVGKTHLSERAWPEPRRIYHLAAETTAEMNRQELSRRLSAEPEIDGEAGGDERGARWSDIARLAETISKRRQNSDGDPLVLVVDEAQYLFSNRTDAGAERMLRAWRREVDSDATLLLVGSGISAAKVLGVDPAELDADLDWSARLDAFDYLDAARFVPERPPGQKAYIYAIFGGLARFLSGIETGSSLGGSVVENVLSPDGLVFTQLRDLFARLPDIRDPGPYRAVLAAVADGARQTKDVARGAGLADSPTVARRALETLEELDLLVRRRNFGAGGRAPWKSRIADPALRFWSRYAHRHRSRLALGEAEEVWRDEITPQLDAYMEVGFEQMVEQGFRRFHDRWGLPAPDRWTRWVGRDRNRRRVEVDLVARLADDRMLTGQIRWAPDPVDQEVHFNLKRDLEALAALGEEWASSALDERESAGFLYASAGGFSEHFRQKARRSDRLHLVSLETLYPEGE